jgi:hypothetical protein
VHPITCPPASPPPPPNCYAVHLCNPTPPSGALTNTPFITKILQGLSSIGSLFAHGHGIIENANKSEKATDGTQPNSNILPEKNNQEDNSPKPAEAVGNGGGGACVPGAGNATVDSFLEVPGEESDWRRTLAYLEDKFAQHIPEIDTLIITSFLEDLPYEGQPGAEIVRSLGLQMKAKLAKMRPSSV